MAKIYSCFWLKNGKHVTWDYNPGKCVLPCEEGASVKVKVVGKYTDKDVDADIVEIVLPSGEILKSQPSGTILHITTATRNGIPPVESGRRATKYGWTEIVPYHIDAISTFFEK